MGRVAIEGGPVQEIAIIDCGLITVESWPGGVSADALIESGKTSRYTIKDAISRLEEFYVQINPGAKTRCIDGRHDPKLDESSLGPQVPAGAPGAALANRIGVDTDDITKGTFLRDAEAMIDNYLRMGFFPGGHRDNNSDGEKKVGCGAIDGMDAIIATMIQPELVNDNKRVANLFIGDDFDADNYQRVMGGAVMVNGRSEEYFDGRGQVLKILEEKAPNSTSTLEGEHEECIVALNDVPNTTLSSNRFADTFGIQAFGYDLWWSKVIAENLFPRPEQSQDRARFVMARVMTTVATLMALTDGSQELSLRVISATEEE